MDIDYLKIKIDIKTEHDEFKKKFDYRKKELKKEEIKKIFDGFKEFFSHDGSFKFKENEHSITAEYKDHGITLDIDVYKSIDNTEFCVEGFIRSFENETADFEVIAVCNKDVEFNPSMISGQEQLLQDLSFYKDFDKGEIYYTFKYRIKGKRDEYNNIQELLKAI